MCRCLSCGLHAINFYVQIITVNGKHRKSSTCIITRYVYGRVTRSVHLGRCYYSFSSRKKFFLSNTHNKLIVRCDIVIKYTADKGYGYAVKYYPKNRFAGKTLTDSIFNIFEIGFFYHKEKNIL